MAKWDRAPEHPFESNVTRLRLRLDPITRVVAQVQFSPVLSVRDDNFVVGFQERVRHKYPLLSKDTQHRVDQDGSGRLQVTTAPIWRFNDTDDMWQLSLSETFVSLHSAEYSDRYDFEGRLRFAVDAVAEFIQPVMSTRIGVRYTNHLTGAALENLGEYIRPQMLGLINVPIEEGGISLQWTAADFDVQDASVRICWGNVPAETTPDDSIEPINEDSWVMDLDAYSEKLAPFDPMACVEEAFQYRELVYSFFRWTVSNEFLDDHGSEPELDMV